jgi:hypothetical protein
MLFVAYFVSTPLNRGLSQKCVENHNMVTLHFEHVEEVYYVLIKQHEPLVVDALSEHFRAEVARLLR